MNAVVRSITSPDVEIRDDVPEDAGNDGVLLRVLAGPQGSFGEESFDVMVCTPAWLSERVRAEGPLVGRHHLIVEPLDLAVATEFLRRRFEATEAATWPELGEKLARLRQWEFEDYGPCR